MGKVNVPIKIQAHMMGSMKMINLMVKEHISGIMVTNIQVCGKRAYLMEWAKI